MPLIRYRTGDFVKCRNAAVDREFPWSTVDSVVGRDYEFLVSATGRRISLTAINMHDRIFDGLLAVQFFQERKGAVELRYQVGRSWDALRVDAMRAGLLRKLGDDFDLVLREVKEMEKTKSGKHRWLTGEIREEEPQRARRNTELGIPAPL
jgi:phenylacetate-CoA ligase